MALVIMVGGASSSYAINHKYTYCYSVCLNSTETSCDDALLTILSTPNNKSNASFTTACTLILLGQNFLSQENIMELIYELSVLCVTRGKNFWSQVTPCFT